MTRDGADIRRDQAQCPRGVDSGVYVLGALSPAERADYAAHLAWCSPCQREVGALAYVAALLSRVAAPATGSDTTSSRERDRDGAPAARVRRPAPWRCWWSRRWVSRSRAESAF
ncbi:zf-HC2 domain-containing protein [Pseudonocardia sp.]|uniref:zf-HC2 domain-containing protein n=1 Tax=Pseudonocardia sp. TaxID=60912 RepID=UPI00345DB022